MTDLRALAERAKQADAYYKEGGAEMVWIDEMDAFHAACSPTVLLALLDERDRLREALERRGHMYNCAMWSAKDRACNCDLQILAARPVGEGTT